MFQSPDLYGIIKKVAGFVPRGDETLDLRLVSSPRTIHSGLTGAKRLPIRRLIRRAP